MVSFTQVEPGKDNIIRKVCTRYKNSNENVFRETRRSVRTVVVIRHVDEVDIFSELGKIASIYEFNTKFLF